jgi:S-adenosylmethionine-diacylgycerolhomoserine-N-methlytransferase
MAFWNDLKTLYHLTISPVRGKTQQERLESFYAKQASGYDSFRSRLLPGRRELFEALPVPKDGAWIDIGGGTGANLEFLGERLGSIRQVIIVDLSPSLLKVAQARIERHGWTNVKTVQADAISLGAAPGMGVPHDALAPQKADVVTFSYSLTMIPDWFAAVDAAWRLLKPGGHIGVVDFHVGRKWPEPGRLRHPWSTRHFWPAWFETDDVLLSPDHIPYLQKRFETIDLLELRARLPYLPLLRAPYFRFIGRKPAES